MRKIYLLGFLFSLGITALQAQDKPGAHSEPEKDTLLPYQKYPVLPAFNIMLMDSSTIFNTYNIPKGKPTAIMHFDPDCKHCKHTMTALLAGMDSVRQVQFYLVTLIHQMESLRKFYQEYHLEDYKNIKVVGRDYEFFFMGHYNTRSLPDVAIYDERKKLVKLIEGEFTASDIYKYINAGK